MSYHHTTHKIAILKTLRHGYVLSFLLFDNVQGIYCRGIGISRSSRHKRSETGAQRAHYRKKRKFELGRQPASTRVGPKRIHEVRVRGGNVKYRALRLESGNFAWASEHVTRKTRIISVVCIPHDFNVIFVSDIYLLFQRSTMPLTTSLSAPTHWSRVPSFRSMRHLSVSGTNPM